ncbi:hypothetical protein [Leifsonia sp. Root4]|uniref:hypothetical protein n=1 Tax=Leifsonia sp. Root4 TaxID=1736525 RepID=UPI0012F72921|nr:hypothetical protein [Leifsonia sp. Root4]
MTNAQNTKTNFTSVISAGQYFLYSNGIFIAGWATECELNEFCEARGIVIA